jgi:predicted RNase H-like HicB family nuclease
VPGIPGAHTQAATLDELQRNLKEVIELCLEGLKGEVEDLPKGGRYYGSDKNIG